MLDEPAPLATQSGLRERVLAGEYFGTRHTDISAALAAMVASQADCLAAWFGDRAAALGRDPQRLKALLTRDIAAIDAMISRQLDAILHHRRMRKFEGSWRGLYWLVCRLGVSGRVKLRFLNVSWAEICRDLERAVEFDQSHLFRAIYEDEFGKPGGEPYGLTVLDHEIRHHPSAAFPTDDVAALTRLAAVAAAAFAPMLVGAAPALLGVDQFTDLSGVADPAPNLAGPEYQRWKRLSTLDDSRFLAVTLPRFLVRLPWTERAERHWGFRYSEIAPGAAEMVFASAGYLVAACVVRAYDTWSWPADMRGYDIGREGGGVVEALPEPMFSTDPRDGFDRPAMEVQLTDRQERLLVAAGLLPVTSMPYGGQALVGAARSLQNPSTRFTGANAAAAVAAAQLSAQFNSMICVSRFAHYVKVMGRDLVGSFSTATEVQKRLQSWLMKFVTANTGAGPETMAKYPLRGAQVSVSEIPGKPGSYGCVIRLQPHYQLDDVTASFRLMTELKAPGQAN
jgi:type VI secretion system protein ImpD/type VI secretion system protein ImpC